MALRLLLRSLAHSIDVTVRLGTILEKSGFAEFLINLPGIEGRLTLLGALLGAVGERPTSPASQFTAYDPFAEQTAKGN
jgi:hypothetical protein